MKDEKEAAIFPGGGVHETVVHLAIGLQNNKKSTTPPSANPGGGKKTLGQCSRVRSKSFTGHRKGRGV